MAKKQTKRSGEAGGADSNSKTPALAKQRESRGSKRQVAKRSPDGDGEGKSAADMLLGLLESPLVADILAVGAAAALAAIAQRGLGRGGGERSSRAALKTAARAAAAAMGTRIAEEIDEIMRSAKESKRERA